MSSIARRMTFGGVVREEQRVNCVERATLANQSLGMDVLSQYRVLIDPAAKKDVSEADSEPPAAHAGNAP